jgi:LPXTG-motif cell wall-anchored protein
LRYLVSGFIIVPGQILGRLYEGETLMRIRGVRTAVLLILAVPAFAIAQGAGSVQRSTKLTVTEPTMVGNVLLEPGTYTLHHRDYQAEKVQVGITRDSDNKTMGTVIASRERRNLDPHEATANQTQFTYTTFKGYPAVATWFFPGDEWGERFLYEGASSEISMRQTTAAAPPVAAAARPAEPAPAPAAEPVPAPAAEPAPVTMTARNEEPKAAPAATPAPKKEKKLPKTASSTPLVGLLGALSLAAAAAVRFGRRKAA